MYSYEQRKKAVELYIQYGFALRAVVRESGYPTSEQSIRNWYKEYQEKQCLCRHKLLVGGSAPNPL